MFKTINWGNKEIRVGHEYLNNLNADGIVLFIKTGGKLKTMIYKITGKVFKKS